jgi:hypothetical protein
MILSRAAGRTRGAGCYTEPGIRLQRVCVPVWLSTNTDSLQTYTGLGIADGAPCASGRPRENPECVGTV